MKLHIMGIKTHVPTTVTTTEARLEALGRPTIEQAVFRRILGFSNIPVTQDNAIEHLLRPLEALKACFFETFKRCKAIIYTHTAEATGLIDAPLIEQVAQKIGLDEALLISTQMAKCAGSIQALSLAEVVLAQQDQHASVILLTGELAFTDELKLISNTALIGECSAAVLLTRNKGAYQCIAHQIKFYGAYAKGIWMTKKEQAAHDAAFIMHFKAICEAALKQAQLSWSEIDLICPHNINLLIWQRLIEALALKQACVVLKALPECAHSLGVDVYLNFERHHRGRYIMMCSVGTGACFACCIFKKNSEGSLC